MDSNKDNGGSAFPEMMPIISFIGAEKLSPPQRAAVQEQLRNLPRMPGMTLLDFFAGCALAGRRACPHHGSEKVTAEAAYKDADAMLRERRKRNGEIEE